MMEVQNSEHSHVIDVCGDVSAVQTSLVGSKFCGEAPCGFSDSKTSSKDAEERSASMLKLLIVVVLCIIFMGVEVVGGMKANSLAVLTDAAHLLSDVAAFAISLFSIWASGWEATPRQSYGFFRIEILGALVSIQLIWLLAGILVYEAIVRLIHENGQVQGFLMFVVSAIGLAVNIAMAFFLGHDHGHGHNHGHDHSHGHDAKHHQHHHGGDFKHRDEHLHSHETDRTEPLLSTCSEEHKPKDGPKQKKQRNINVQGAYLHVLGDSIQSVGVMIGGAIIWYKPEWKIIDLICTLAFSAIVLGTTFRMLRNILEILMESTPREVDATRLEKGLCEMEEVVAIHELHIWAITVGKVLLACHVKINGSCICCPRLGVRIRRPFTWQDKEQLTHHMTVVLRVRIEFELYVQGIVAYGSCICCPRLGLVIILKLASFWLWFSSNRDGTRNISVTRNIVQL